MNITQRAGAVMDRAEQRVGRAAPVVLRIGLGLLWLANVHWKVPNDFGKTGSRGLFKYLDPAKRGPSVFDPFTWLVDKVIIPNFTLFGWFTLLSEIMLAAALLAGWKVRWVALIGAGLSVSIGLSVVNYLSDQKLPIVEWPWSYILMVIAHLGLFGMASGKVFGADGLHAGNARRGWLAAGAAAVALGAWAVAKTGWDDGSTFAGTRGVLLGNEWGELKFMRVNGVGALTLLVIGLLAIAAWRRDDRNLGMGAAAVAALAAVVGLLTWKRPVDGAETGGVLGVEGGAVAVFLMLALVTGTAWWQRRTVSVSPIDQ
jgi:uncharacterized membrane protein YphA (DoxX/SURF4 family)